MPTTSNKRILDAYIRHQTHLIRYAGGLRNSVLPHLANSEGDLHSAILKWVVRTDKNRTLTGSDGRKWQKDFEKVLRAIREPAWGKVSTEIITQLKQLAINEADVAASIIDGAVPVALGMSLPPAAHLVGIVNSMPFQGRTLNQWMQDSAAADVKRLLSASKIGIVQGQTPTQVARNIIGTKEMQYKDGVARVAFKDTESVILTVTNGIQNEAKQALYKANSEIIKDELFVATLDGRTTIICASLDGKTFKTGTGPIPPLHFRCRSLRVPYINADNLLNRGYDSRTEQEILNEYTKKNKIDGVKTRGDLPRGHKGNFDAYYRKRGKELVGQVPAKTTYNEWLKTQSVEFQNGILGVSKAKIFREGGITLDKFVARNGDVLTLDQLKSKGMAVPEN